LRFVYGEVPKNTDFSFEGFISLDEPDKSRFMMIAGLVQVALWSLFLFAWIMFDSNVTNHFSQTSLIEYVFIVLIIIPVHELFHTMIYPLKNHAKIVLGLWPKMGVLYAIYEGKLTRDRWLLVYVMPLMLISVVPFVFAIYFDVHSWFVIASILNAGFAAGDVVAIVMILHQVPKRAVIV